MGESACLMQPFSYASGIANEAKEGNPIYALGQSISFGRFMSESLAWEKWSTFSHNRYVEEAEKYSRPGSVAQKKAFFEAHYKKIAARKAAALLEQANTNSNDIPQTECEDIVENITTHEPQTKILDSQVALDEQQNLEALNSEKTCSALNANWHNLNVEMVKSESSKMEGADLVIQHQLVEDGLSNQLEDVEAAEMELSGRAQMEIPLLQKNSDSNQVVLVSVSEKKGELSSSKSLMNGRASKFPSSPAKHTAPTGLKKKSNATPFSKKLAIDFSDRNKSTPKSVHKSINFSPAREFNKFTSTVMRKIESSRLGANSSKTYKDCSTPLRTPLSQRTPMAALNGVSKHPSATPHSENRRAKTPLDYSTSWSKAKTPLDYSASGSIASGRKWRFLSTDCSKFLSAGKNKSEYPVLSSPFSLRTEDRAARRKEKLEEKFNANETQKVQLQTKLKEKAEIELKRLRQSLCFKARPLPNFYKERNAAKNQTEKVPLAHPQSPKLGRKPTPSTVQGTTTSLPPQRPPAKNCASKHVLGKRSQIHSFTSRSAMITHENTSPNIQNGKRNT